MKPLRIIDNKEIWIRAVFVAVATALVIVHE
jgi:hypothetical protein